jgi:replicative superfamily II helicase
MPESVNREAFEGLMGSFTSESRFVVWASEPGQVAYEDVELAHGYLSHALLQGVSRARAAGKSNLRIGDWLTDAAAEVGQLAERAGRVQQAGCYAMLSSGASIQVTAVGPHQRRLSETEGIAPVTSEIESLRAYGFRTEDFTALRSRLGASATLNQLQQDAVSPGGVLSGRSVLVRAPTSGGKTLVAELAMLKQWRTGRKTIVLLPLRALVRELADALVAHYGQHVGIRVIVSTGEIDDDDDLLVRSQYDVAILTYEKFAAVLGYCPRLIDEIGVVVFDEIHLIADEHRGRSVELLLVRLRRAQRGRGWPQLIILCGELANLQQLEKWLGLYSIGTSVRPIPLDEGVVTASGEARMRKAESGAELSGRIPGLPSALPSLRVIRYEDDERAQTAASITKAFVLDESKQVVLFCTTKRNAIRLARWLAQDLKLAPIPTLIAAPSRLDAEEQHRASEMLVEVARHGVAFHFADLNQNERELVEAAFRSGELRVIVATTTLAMGVNLPADVVLIVDHSFWQGFDRPLLPLSIAEYRNMAGRAGRLIPGGPQRGTALLIARSEQEQTRLWQRYLADEPPGLGSNLDKLGVQDLALALLQLRADATPVELAEDLSDTFWGFLQDNQAKWSLGHRRALEEALAIMGRDGFVVQASPGRWRLTPQGIVVSGFGIQVDSARRVRAAASALQIAGERIDGFGLIAMVQLLSELDDILMPKGETPLAPRPPQFRDRDTLWQIVTASDGPTASTDPNAAGNRIHRVLGLVHWSKGKSLREIERLYGRESDQATPIAASFRNMVERTSDFLPAVAALVSRDHPKYAEEFKALVPRLRSQLAAGGDEAVGRLFAMRLGLSRGECRALARLGIDSNNLRAVLIERTAEIEAELSTPRMLVLKQRLSDPRLTRRRSDQAEQFIFEGLGEGTPF